MPQYTDKFNLGYYEEGEITDAITEVLRWSTVDHQLGGLFDIFGNGVISGWDFSVYEDENFLLAISPGYGHVGGVAVESTGVSVVELAPSTRNYIYAVKQWNSSYTKNVGFVSTAVHVVSDDYLYLGYVDTAADSALEHITDTDIEDRVYISFRQQIYDFIKNHRHIGGTTNPDKVNLATDVIGFLREENIDDLDASFILTGTIDVARLPRIDHITQLINNGVLTHAQLDTFVQILNNDGARLMGETSSTNLLKLILALKHIYPTIDEYLINELAFIPGISPDSIVDVVNTTATVDYRTAAQGGTHTITGTPAPSTSLFTKAWDEESEFLTSVRDNIVVVGGSLWLATTETRAFISDFEDTKNWEATTVDLSSVASGFDLDSLIVAQGNTSGKVQVGSSDAEIAFILKKTFEAQDWSEYDRITFQIYCDEAEHGDIFFYLYDGVAGSQNSYVMVLERNSLSINRDNLDVGWREVVVDISALTRSNVTSVGFYTSTLAGWQVNSPFTFNVDNMFLSTGNRFEQRGTAIFSYGNDYPHVFSAVRWDASTPAGTSVLVRTRVSDTADMSSAIWSDYILVSGDSIVLPNNDVYHYIDIEVTLEANTGLDASPEITALYLDSVVTSAEYTFEFDNQDAWESGDLSNIDTETTPGSISISNVNDLGTYLYGTAGSLVQLNSDLSERLSILGINAPKSFSQILNGTSPGLGQISGIDVGLRNSFIVADTDNDRILEIDKNGCVLWGLMGTFPLTPVNPYASSVASSVADSASASTDTDQAELTNGEETARTATDEVNTFEAVGCFYNVEDSALYLMFNAGLEDIYSSTFFDPQKMFLKAGVRRIYLNKSNTVFRLVGTGSEVVDSDAPETEFQTSSNVMKITLSSADAVAMSTALGTENPYLVITSPYKNQVTSGSTMDIQVTAYNCTIGNNDYGIRIQLDSGATQDLRTTTSKEFTSLSVGSHVVSVSLIDENGNVLANEGATASLTFYKYLGSLSESVISILSPQDNQILPAAAISISYATYNVPVGYSVKYAVDGGSLQASSGSPLVLTGFDNGEHTIRLVLADSSDVVLSGTMTDVSVTVVAGNRNGTTFKISVGASMIQDEDGNANLESLVDVDVNNVRPANVYAPVDVQLIVSESAVGDASSFNVLVAKVPTKSYRDYYSKNATVYQDGHSVVEFTNLGAVAMSSNDALIAKSKEDAKNFLGGATKEGTSEFFIADAANNRAIVSEINTGTRESSIIWEFVSDRVISSFMRVPEASEVNEIRESGLVDQISYLRRDNIYTWYNATNDTIRIVSGVTTYSQFYADPDFDLFGSVFDSGDIAPGEYYQFRFLNNGTFYYFVYPFIYAGRVIVSETSITPNDTFIIAENDPVGSSHLNRILKVDAWGNVQWAFGQGFTSRIKNARPTSATEIVIVC